MKVAICDYKEPLNRDLEIEKSVFKIPWRRHRNFSLCT